VIVSAVFAFSVQLIGGNLLNKPVLLKKHCVVIPQGYTPIWISIHAILIATRWKELRRRALIRNRLFPKWSFVLPKKIWVKTMIRRKHMWVIIWLALACRDWKNSPAHD